MKSSQGFKPRLCHLSLSTLFMVWGRRGMNLEQEIRFAQLFQFYKFQELSVAHTWSYISDFCPDSIFLQWLNTSQEWKSNPLSIQRAYHIHLRKGQRFKKIKAKAMRRKMEDRKGLWIGHYIRLPLSVHVYPLNFSPEQHLLEKMQ